MVFALLRRMSGWSLHRLHRVGVLIGWTVYFASPTYRARLRSHAAAAGLDEDAQRSAVSHAGRMVGELPYLWLRPHDEPLGERVRFAAGEDILREAVDAGRGVVLMTPHLGAFEVTAQVYAEKFGHTQPLTAMYRPARLTWLRELQRTARNRPGMLAAPASMVGLRQMLRALRRGETVGLLPDQVPPEGMGVWAPYFGRSAYTMTLAARLVQQTGASVVLMTGLRLQGDEGFEVRAHRLDETWPEPPTRGALHEVDEAYQVACASMVNRAMERLVRQCPEQYLWGYHRYKKPRAVAAMTEGSDS